MGERNRFSRWRRLPPVFRSGEHKLPGYEDDTQRLTLYLPGSLLDLAELLANLEQAPSVQEYCSNMLARALEDERVRRKVAKVEADRGPLRGLDEIARDAEYLAEWQARNDEPRHAPEPPTTAMTVPLIFLPPPDEPMGDGRGATALEASRPLTVRVQTGPRPEPIVARETPPEIPTTDGTAMHVVWKHVDPEGIDPRGFLPHLRRGHSVPADAAAELLEALRALESENRGADRLPRILAYAVHRLALESQVLLTEAWPGAFDEPTVEVIRAVQEMAERILSGDESGPESRAAGGAL